MLSRLEVTNAAGDVLVLPMTNEGTGYVVESITGLGPVKASIATSNFANLDGAQFQSSRREPRNIVIRLLFEPNYYNQTVQSMRQALYAWFASENIVQLRFHIGTGLDYDITGYVETMELALFSKDPAVDVSILCMNPDFTDSDALTYSGRSTPGLIETDFDYTGTSTTGFSFVLSPRRSVDEFDIYVRSPNGALQILSFAYPLVDHDVLTINTVVGSKSATLLRGGVEEAVLYAVSSQSSWIQLKPGMNHIRVAASGSPIPYVVNYRNTYGGL